MIKSAAVAKSDFLVTFGIKLEVTKSRRNINPEYMWVILIEQVGV